MIINDILIEKGCEVCSISPEQKVRDAVTVMNEHDTGSVLVMEDNQIKGILTKQNILCALGKEGDIVTQYRVAELMSINVLTCAPEDSAEHALHVMNHNNVNHLPVVEEGKVCGIISMWDIMKASNSAYQFENRLLKRYIQAWPEEQRGGGLKLVVNNKFRPSPEKSGMSASGAD
jgi:CBS domain-containing protein